MRENSKRGFRHFIRKVSAESLESTISLHNIEEAVEIDEKTRWKNQVGKIKEFIESPWGETKEREVILDKTNKEKFK